MSAKPAGARQALLGIVALTALAWSFSAELEAQRHGLKNRKPLEDSR